MLLFGMLTAGFILVGGQSRRMGRDKALLPWKSGVLAQDIAAKLEAISGGVTLIGDPARYGHLGYACIPDLRPGLGPLSGIETALRSGLGDYNLILACDMPGIHNDHLARLLAYALRSELDCVVTSDAMGTIHPLCAVYRSRCLPLVTAALDQNRLRLSDLTDELQARVLLVQDKIRNVNTIEDWEALHTAHG